MEELNNKITVNCPHCEERNEIHLGELVDDHHIVQCIQCGKAIATVGQLHAKLAQQAAGIGDGDLADDHVPLGGPPFGSTT